MRMPSKILATAALVIGAAACSKHDEAGKAAGVPAMNTPPPSAPVAAPPPAPSPPPAPEKPIDPNAKITGQVVLAPAMKSHVAPTDTVFIVARRIPDNPSARGTLVAVKKVTASKFPIEFEISAADM